MIGSLVCLAMSFEARSYDHNFRVISIPIGISRPRALTIDIAKAL